MTDAEITRLRKLYEALQENQARTDELIAEIGKCLNGDAGIGVVLKRLELALSDIWRVRYRSAYLWQYTKDRPQMKRLLKTLEPVEIEARWQNYLRSEEKFYVDARHGFGLFVTQINRFADAAPAELTLSAPPVGCRHTPPCADDQAHTRQRAEELYGIPADRVKLL